MVSAQTLLLEERRVVAAWAADCAERALPLFEAEAGEDRRPRDAIARTRAFARGDLQPAGEIRRRFHAGRAAGAVTGGAAVAAARSAAQAAAVAHLGAHALGAAAYAVRAAGRAGRDEGAELRWQIDRMSPAVRAALRRLPPLDADPHGPLGAGLLASGDLGATIRRIQAELDPAAQPVRCRGGPAARS